ncbi:beta-N-acetylhexosaminidase [Geminicoccus roseus]|uniref:beta-N-acetylhexosaminidase n=1 Tax=Geminicoccus roseus TaxID=404900 RepID=UPI000417F149|nr:beta-N-acetylhexosaminidase [Geminicoccus roseus]
MLAGVLGIDGTELTDEERDFLRETPPAGVILFARNIADRDQLRRLTDAIRTAASPARPLVFIDQEGGRVMRLRPPVWRSLPAMARIGELCLGNPGAADLAAEAVGRLIGADLAEAGIDVACAPVLDVAAPGLTEAIGSRAFSGDPEVVSRLGRKVADGLLAAGILPVIKHLPGHGRALVDSHMGLPVVEAGRDDLAARDFRPFQALADLPIGMTAHILFRAIDPDRPATLSARVIEDVIRGEIGFAGLLLSDDLGMGALSGGLAGRASDCLAAGCDLALACSGRIEDARVLAQTLPELAGEPLRRYEQALAFRPAAPAAVDVAADEHHLRATHLVA